MLVVSEADGEMEMNIRSDGLVNEALTPAIVNAVARLAKRNLPMSALHIPISTRSRYSRIPVATW